MRSECDGALDNPSGGCPSVPRGIRSPRTIIIGNICSGRRRDGIFCGIVCGLRNLVKGHWRLRIERMWEISSLLAF